MQKAVYEFISQQINDPIVERKTCVISGEEFPIYQSDKEFYDSMNVPFPTLCPDERAKRRLAWRNERVLYKRKCDATGKEIISIYAPNTPYKVYSQKQRRSDERDSMQYGFSIDFTKSFSEQFDVLLKTVPHLSLYTLDNENSEYTHGVTALKNCYMCFNVDGGEDSYYSALGNNIKKTVDSDMIYDSEIIYASINCKNCFHVFYSIDCEDSSYLSFCKNCISCRDCFLCINKQNAQYCVNNIQYTKEEYEQKKQEYLSQYSHQELQKMFLDSANVSPQKHIHGSQNEGVTGDYIYNSKNTYNSYESTDLEDCKHCIYVSGSKNCHDFTVYGDGCENVYDSVMVGPGGYNIRFSAAIWLGSRDILYSFLLVNCKNCFGCMSLRNKEYCIFNKQYTKEEYEKIIPQLIQKMKDDQEWGMFFHPFLCPRGYNETMGVEYSPLTKEQALKRGFIWREEKEKHFEGSAYSPKSIFDYQGDEEEQQKLLTSILKCKISGKPFRISKQELIFYLKYNLPIPTKHPDIRHQERVNLRSPRKLGSRFCDKCGVSIITTYPSDFQGNVYCEKCYNQEVYS